MGTLRSVPSADLEAHRLLKVIIAYEDFATGHRAMRACENLIGQLGREFQFQTSLWKFEILRLPKLEPMAGQDAVEADVVIISAHGRGELPAEVKKWMERWLSRTQEVAKALVALLDEEEEGAEEDCRVGSYLQEFARKAHFDFFWRVYPNSESEMAFSSSQLAVQAEAGSWMMEENPGGPTAMRQWGINE